MVTSNHSGRRGLQQRLQLHEVQIVGRRDAFQAELVLEILRGQPVGDVERVIADAAVVGEIVQVIVVADQVAVGLAGPDLLQGPVLAHLEDSWRGYEHLAARSCGAQARNRRTASRYFFGSSNSQ